MITGGDTISRTFKPTYGMQSNARPTRLLHTTTTGIHALGSVGSILRRVDGQEHTLENHCISTTLVFGKTDIGCFLWNT